MKGKWKVCTLEKRRDRNPRTVVDTPPDLKAEYASFCQAMGITVSERTRALWLRDMIAFDGATEDAPKETA